METHNEFQYRDGYAFRYYFNAGLDRRTGHCDEEGTDVYIVDAIGNLHFEQEVCGIFPDDIMNMTDEEFSQFLAENGIF